MAVPAMDEGREEGRGGSGKNGPQKGSLHAGLSEIYQKYSIISHLQIL